MAKAFARVDDDTRPLIEIADETIAILRQDASEYAFIALIGAVPAALVVLVPGLMRGPFAMSLIAPLLILIALFTYAAATAALCVGANQLQPDAATAFATAARRFAFIIIPWLPLIAALWAASYAGAAFAHDLGPVPHVTIVAAIVAAGAWYAFPRLVAIPAIFDQDLSWRHADRVSHAIVRDAPRRIAALWLAVLAPAIATASLGLITGFDTVIGAVVACFFVAALPVAASMMTLVLVEAATRMRNDRTIR